MKNFKLSWALFAILFSNILAIDAMSNCQESSCSYGDRGGANCHKFVRNYFESNYNLSADINCGYYNLNSQQQSIIHNASQGAAINNYASFFNYYLKEVNSLSQADVVAYENNINEVLHSAVVLSSGWPTELISKWESDGPVVKHDLYEVPSEYYQCNNSNYKLTYWKWQPGTNPPDPDPDPACSPSSASVTGSHNKHRSGSNCVTNSLFTYNQVCSGQIKVTLNSISGVSYQWTKTSGSIYYSTASSGKYAYIYLYSGSASFKIQPMNCEGPINTPRSVYFTVSSGGSPYAFGIDQSNELEKVELWDASGNLLETKFVSPGADERFTQQCDGLHIIRRYDAGNNLIDTKKIYNNGY